MSRRPRHTAERPVLDLRKIKSEHVHRGIRVVLTWMWDHAERDYEPCIALLKMRPPVVPCIIPLSASWRWALHDGVGDPHHVAETVRDWLTHGYLPGSPFSKTDAMAVLNAVDSRLRDLVLMPPRPVGDIVTMADAILTDSRTGKVVSEDEVKADV